MADGVTQDPNVAAFTPASGGRAQLKVRGVGGWDAHQGVHRFGVRAPISRHRRTDADVVAGRALFIDSNCQACHGGAQWSSSKVRGAAPPDASLVVGAQLIRNCGRRAHSIPRQTNEIRATAVAPLGATGLTSSLLSLLRFRKHSSTMARPIRSTM